MKGIFQTRIRAKQFLVRCFLVVFLSAAGVSLYAQSGGGSSQAVTALTTVKTDISKIFSVASTLCLVVGGIIGLVGGIIVFQKWQQGDPQTTKFIAGWIGSTVFLVLTGTILKTIFNIQAS